MMSVEERFRPLIGVIISKLSCMYLTKYYKYYCFRPLIGVIISKHKFKI